MGNSYLSIKKKNKSKIKVIFSDKNDKTIVNKDKPIVNDISFSPIYTIESKITSEDFFKIESIGVIDTKIVSEDYVLRHKDSDTKIFNSDNFNGNQLFEHSLIESHSNSSVDQIFKSLNKKEAVDNKE